MATAEPPTDPPWDDPGEQPFEPGRNPSALAPVQAVPNDQAAERYILGAALHDRDQISVCGRLVTAADFWNPWHETLWRTLSHLTALDQPTEPQAVIAHLIDTDAKNFHRQGGAPYVFDLYQNCPIPGNAAFYAARVEELSRQRTAIRVFEKGLARLRQPGADIDEALNTAAADLTTARDDLGNLPPITTWSPVDLAPVFAGEYLDPPPTMLMRSDGIFLFYAGSVHVIAGESESGKTWLALLACVQEIQLGSRVVFIDFEDRADRVIGRLLGLGATPDEIRANFAYIRPDRPLDDAGRHQLSPAITGASLVIIDGVTEAMTMHGFDLNSNADAAHYLALLPRWIADHGPAVTMIDHVVKDKEKQDRFAVGAQHKLAGIDGVQYLVKMITPFARGKRGLARIDIGKDRPGHVRGNAHGKVIAEFTLDATSGDERILLAHLMPPTGSGQQGDHWEPTGIMEKVSRLVETNPSLSKSAIENMVNGKAATIRTALELLITRGYIGTKRGPKNAILHVHVRQYREDDDPAQTDAAAPPHEPPGSPWDDPDYTPDEPANPEDEPDTELDIPDPETTPDSTPEDPS